MALERTPHDPAYKQFFSDPEMVESLLLDFVPIDFIKELDFSILERCSGSYVTPEFQNLQEVGAMLEERVAQWKDEYIRQGVLSGIALGEARGKALGQAMTLRACSSGVLARQP